MRPLHLEKSRVTGFAVKPVCHVPLVAEDGVASTFLYVCYIAAADIAAHRYARRHPVGVAGHAGRRFFVVAGIACLHSRPVCGEFRRPPLVEHVRVTVGALYAKFFDVFLVRYPDQLRNFLLWNGGIFCKRSAMFTR